MRGARSDGLPLWFVIRENLSPLHRSDLVNNSCYGGAEGSPEPAGRRDRRVGARFSPLQTTKRCQQLPRRAEGSPEELARQQGVVIGDLLRGRATGGVFADKRSGFTCVDGARPRLPCDLARGCVASARPGVAPRHSSIPVSRRTGGGGASCLRTPSPSSLYSAMDGTGGGVLRATKRPGAASRVRRNGPAARLARDQPPRRCVLRATKRPGGASRRTQVRRRLYARAAV